jgi:hypothetical protein
VGALVAVLAAWGWALWYSVARPEPEPLDAVSRGRVVVACRAALDGLRALAPLPTGAGPRAVAERIDAEDGVFAAMLDALRAVSPRDDEGAEALAGWLADWELLLGARARHADELRATGDRVDFRIPAQPGSSRPVTVRMNDYARQKGLDDCSSDRLQVEVVDTPRRYPDE